MTKVLGGLKVQISHPFDKNTAPFSKNHLLEQNEERIGTMSKQSIFDKQGEKFPVQSPNRQSLRLYPIMSCRSQTSNK